MADIKTASVLAFERKLDPSDAFFSAGEWDDQDNAQKWPAVEIRPKSVRGTISNRLKTKDQDPAKLDASIQSPNLQTVDVATLPSDADTLRVCFTLKVLGGAGTPSACNNSDYQQKLMSTVAGYVESNGFSELAQRYAYNIANGRFLWRNRLGAEQVVVQVTHVKDGVKNTVGNFNALDFSLRDFSVPGDAVTAFNAFAQVIENGLSGKTYTLLEIIAYVRVGGGQEVYPSQELILDKGKSDKSKTLYQINKVAGMHSQKIGNALRTIDTWYEDVDNIGPIAVEPYGSVTSRGKAYRQPKQNKDFYKLFDKWMEKDVVPEIGDQHFVMATLIRGGVFGSSDKD